MHLLGYPCNFFRCHVCNQIKSNADIWLQEIITKSKWVYDYNTRDFYVGLWGNILTGIIVALATSYVSYGCTKHQVESSLLCNEQKMCMAFQNIMCGVYTADKEHTHNNVCRFKYEYTMIEDSYKNMIISNNDYAPFIQTKKSKILFDGKEELQHIWVDLVAYEDDLRISPDENSTQKIIAQIQDKLLESKDVINSRASMLKSLLV
jgi:hypothetical protein